MKDPDHTYRSRLRRRALIGLIITGLATLVLLCWFIAVNKPAWFQR